MRKNKFLITILVGICMLLCMPALSYATNEDLVIVKQSESEYIIYMKQYLKHEFEFAFSNDKLVDVATLSFTKSALDTSETEANNIAYVESGNFAMFANTTYMWIKVNGEIKVSEREINLSDNITKANLELVGTTSKTIPVTLEQEEVVNKENEEGTKITETIGVAKLAQEITDAKYQIIKRNASENTEALYELAELIEKNAFTDIYTEITASKEFYELLTSELNNLKEEDWKVVENNTIKQPADAQNGEQYILYVSAGNKADVHFLTSYREYKEEYVKEQITTLLPHTYDNNTILIALGIVVVAIILVTVRIIILKKKEMK